MDYKLEEKITADVTLDDLSRGFFSPSCIVYSNEEDGMMELIIKEEVGNKTLTIKFKNKTQ